MARNIQNEYLTWLIAKQIELAPGSNQAQIARQLGYPTSTVRRYVQRLIDSDVVYAARVGAGLRLYVDPLGQTDMKSKPDRHKE